MLIVDDDKDLLDLMLAQFKAFGFNLLSATSGNEAIEVIDRESPKIVVTDYRMEDGDGLAVLRHCKSKNAHEPKVFIVSGFALDKIADLYQEGADGFFSKPFAASELRTNIQRATLDRRTLWAKHFEKTNHELLLNFKDVADVFDGKQIKFGRGGFCVYSPSLDFDVETVVDVGLVVQDGAKHRLQGRIVWKMKKPMCFGVEIYSADPKLAELIVSRTSDAKHKAFIPSA